VRDTFDVDFGSYLRDAMRAVGIDPDQRGGKAELARRSGLSENLISRWVRGTQPDIPGLRKLAPVLRRPMRELVVKAGHLAADEVINGADDPAVSRTPEESILADERLTRRQREILISTYHEMRERYKTDDPSE
jgi:transcriptional regulator with XRE-family HTH domain